MLASDDNVSDRTIYRHDGTVWGANGTPLIPAVAPFMGPFVRLRLEENRVLYFHLREVEIYGFAGASGGGTGGRLGGTGGGVSTRVVANTAAGVAERPYSG